MNLILPDPALVLLPGVAGSGKSTFARKHFRATSILSSDHLRGLILDDESDQSANGDVFAALHFIADKRLRHRRLTVIDATSVLAAARRPLLEIAAAHQIPAVAIVFNLPEQLCQQRNRQRPERQVDAHIIHEQYMNLQQSLSELPQEGFHTIVLLSSAAEIDALTIECSPR